MNSLVAASRRATVTALRRTPTPVSAAAATATGSVSATTVAQGGVIGVGVVTRSMHSPVLKTAYNTLWKRTPVYVTYIVVGCIVLEFVYGKVGDAIFDSINKGKQYKDIDWSKFADEEEEEEEEEEDDE